MDNFMLTRDGDRDVKFEGERLVNVSSRDHNSTRWTDIRLYRSKAGRLIAHMIGRTQWEREGDRYSVIIPDGMNDQEVVDALQDQNDGELSWLAKTALHEAGIDCTQEID